MASFNFHPRRKLRMNAEFYDQIPIESSLSIFIKDTVKRVNIPFKIAIFYMDRVKNYITL